jgi:hypothetical protein
VLVRAVHSPPPHLELGCAPRVKRLPVLARDQAVKPLHRALRAIRIVVGNGAHSWFARKTSHAPTSVDGHGKAKVSRVSRIEARRTASHLHR